MTPESNRVAESVVPEMPVSLILSTVFASGASGGGSSPQAAVVKIKTIPIKLVKPWRVRPILLADMIDTPSYHVHQYLYHARIGVRVAPIHRLLATLGAEPTSKIKAGKPK
jgi:hypothetical protein